MRGTRPFHRSRSELRRRSAEVPGPPVARPIIARHRAVACPALLVPLYRLHRRIATKATALATAPGSRRVRQGELATYRSAAFYTTGARVFERLHESGSRWLATPAATRRKYRHLGHMSWAGGADELAERTRHNELHVGPPWRQPRDVLLTEEPAAGNQFGGP